MIPLDEATTIVAFVFYLCIFSMVVTVICVFWGLTHLWREEEPAPAERPSWVCESCRQTQPAANIIESIRGYPVCDDCLPKEQDRIASGRNASWEDSPEEIEQDARREGREDERHGYQRRDGN